VAEQILNAQKDLDDWLGKKPSGIAYPNGNYSDTAIESARITGLKYGFSLNKNKTPLPLKNSKTAFFTLGRFTLWGHTDIEAQCEIARSDFPL